MLKSVTDTIGDSFIITTAGGKVIVIDGALCVAATPRTFAQGVDLAPLADICVKGGAAHAPVGLFGRFRSLTIVFDRPVEGCRVLAQNLLCDTAADVTAQVLLSGNRLRVPGKLMTEIGAPEDAENGIPAVVLRLML